MPGLRRSIETTGKRIAVLGADTHGVAEALFLRSYSRHVTLLPARFEDVSGQDRAKLAAAGVTLIDIPVFAYDFSGKEALLTLDDGSARRFDILYPALGTSARNELAARLGTALSQGGCISADAHLATNVEGVWTAGDVVAALDQVAVAMGHAAIAATAMHNWLRDRDA